MKESEVNVRQANSGDFENIVNQYGAKGNTPWNPFCSIEKLNQIPLDGLLVAEVNGEYAGFLYWFEGSEPKNDSNVEKFAQILEVNPLEKFAENKVGIFLLREALRQTEKAGLYTSYVHANERNAVLCRFYEDIGYTVMARTLHYRLTNPKNKDQRETTRDEAREMLVHMVELREECRMLLISYKELRELIAIVPSRDMAERRILSSRIWSRLQSVMSSASVISKLLWPTPMPREDGEDKRAILRARRLRKTLNIREMNSILPRNVRNAFEHIDERLIEWLPNQPYDIPWGWSLSPFENEEEEPADSKYAFRYYNLNTEELRVAGASCNLRDVVKYVSTIESKIPVGADVIYGEPDDSEGRVKD